MKNGERLEGISIERWLRRYSGNNTFDRFWVPLLRAKMGDQWTDSSAAFMWATMRRLTAARRKGLRREEFGYVRGGYARVFDRFESRLSSLGAKIRVGEPVDEVRRTAGGLEIRSQGGTERFDSVVVATAAPLAASMCTDLTDAEKLRLDAVRYVGVVCSSLLLPAALSSYYLTYVTDAATPFTGVVEMTAMIDPAELGGQHLVYLPKYVVPDDPLFEATDQQIQAQMLPYLASMYPHFDPALMRAFRVSRVRRVFAIPTLHYSRTQPSMSTTVPGLQLIGSANLPFSTLNVDDTLSLVEHLR